ncbi:MAG: hypothetical protein ACK55Z_13820, partial [bacterium]
MTLHAVLTQNIRLFTLQNVLQRNVFLCYSTPFCLKPHLPCILVVLKDSQHCVVFCSVKTSPHLDP